MKPARLKTFTNPILCKSVSLRERHAAVKSQPKLINMSVVATPRNRRN